MAVACGTICAFHVGGAAGENRWEFFVGDLPHAPAVGSFTASTGPGDGPGLAIALHSRQPMAQVASIQDLLEAGEVGLSAEVVLQVSPLCRACGCLKRSVALHASLRTTLGMLSVMRTCLCITCAAHRSRISAS
jgi:hypothetical protein